jgi:hypothetical protein
MSEKKTALLNEQTTRRFWKLANIGSINEMGYNFGRDDEEEPLEEVELEENELEEAELDEVDLEEEEGMDEPAGEDMEMDMDAAPEADMEMDDGEVDAEVSIPEADVEALRTAKEVIDQILGAADAGGDDEGDLDLGDDEGEMDMDAGMEPEEPALEEGEHAEEEDLDEERLEEVVRIVTDRVATKVLREALLQKIKK